MKKRTIAVIILLMPIVLFEIFLRIRTDLFKKVLLSNATFSEWKQAAPKMDEWPDVLVMGSSIAREDIDASLFGKSLNHEGVKGTAGNIANNGQAVVHDYLTVKRIFETCRKCPKVIVYQVTNIAFKKEQIWLWKASTLGRILKLYYPDDSIDKLLSIASQSDPLYRQYTATVRFETFFRTYFASQRLISTFKALITKAIGMGIMYEPTYSDENPPAAYISSIDEKSRNIALSYARDELDKYSLGGVPELFFREYVAELKRRNVKLILLLAPQNKTFSDKFAKEDALFSGWVGQFGKDNRLPVIDTRGYISSDDSSYFDLTHLNLKGSIKYSEYLGQEIGRTILKD